MKNKNLNFKNSTMKAALFHAPHQVRLEEINIPDIGPDEVLVKVRAALTCGTDRKTYLRGHHLFNPPFVFGHEFAGDIVKVGSKVKNFTPGMRVVAANSAPCNSCFYCKNGEHSLCDSLFIQLSGAFAEYIKIPAIIVSQNLLLFPETVSYKEAALLEPLSCVVHGVEESNINLGDTVVINGAGPIGLMFLQVVKLKGARVIVTDTLEERLKLAMKLGAYKAINVSKVQDPIEEVKKFTEDKRGADVAIEAVGLPEIWEQTISMVRKGGMVNLFGGCKRGTKISIDTSLIHYSQINIKGVFHHTPGHVKRALNLICNKAIDIDSLITDEFPLSEISTVIELMLAHKGLKIAVIP
ncbi:MAG: zinc-binding dehydrogenase [Candidatus Caldatribacteriota bacterium]|nr:zinc-binding dehydrogenase [Candidatus Caldatribacteriota bacterium]